MAVPEVFEGLRIIDADTHLTEPPDLWTHRAPARFRDRVPRVETVKGHTTWVVDGMTLGRAGGAAVIRRDGTKVPGTDFLKWSFDDVHPGAHSIPERLQSMDELGVWGQIVYPNTFGFGGQGFFKVGDEELRLLTARLYNDAMAEIQEESGGRLMPMAVLPWWDIDKAVAEAERTTVLGLHGINTTSAPHHHGLPDLGAPYWDPLWEVCSTLGLPVNFHIGAAESDMEWFGGISWPSLGLDQKFAVGSAMLYLNNAGVLANLIFSGVLERHPQLQVVSVESGIGWIPFFMEALDHQVGEMAPAAADALSMTPSDYFRRQIHACFWFEQRGVGAVIDALGHNHLMFETDYPHPTCTYPEGLEIAAEALAGFEDEVVGALMGGNATRLYRIDPGGAAEVRRI
jgi:uncharacterized protein